MRVCTNNTRPPGPEWPHTLDGGTGSSYGSSVKLDESEMEVKRREEKQRSYSDGYNAEK